MAKPVTPRFIGIAENLSTILAEMAFYYSATQEHRHAYSSSSWVLLWLFQLICGTQSPIKKIFCHAIACLREPVAIPIAVAKPPPVALLQLFMGITVAISADSHQPKKFSVARLHTRASRWQYQLLSRDPRRWHYHASPVALPNRPVEIPRPLTKQSKEHCS